MRTQLGLHFVKVDNAFKAMRSWNLKIRRMNKCNILTPVRLCIFEDKAFSIVEGHGDSSASYVYNSNNPEGTFCFHGVPFEMNGEFHKIKHCRLGAFLLELEYD